MRIEIVFLTDVPPRYRAGEVRAVAGGYARNFLFPKGMAVPASAEQRKRIDKIKQVADERRSREALDLRGVAERLEGMAVTIKTRAGERGRLYGSVTTTTIAEAIEGASGQKIDRRLVHLAEPIREVGTFSVTVRFNQDVAPTVSVVVEDESGRYRAQAPAAAVDAEAGVAVGAVPEQAAEAPASTGNAPSAVRSAEDAEIEVPDNDSASEEDADS